MYTVDTNVIIYHLKQDAKAVDVFYFTQGVPSPRDEIIEAGGDVLLRVNNRSKKIRGFTLLNATRHQMRTKKATDLPFTLTQVGA